MIKKTNYILSLKHSYWKFYNVLNKIWNAYKPIIEIPSDIKETILVLGSGRSGTTWVGDVISKMLKARPIFEPFLLSRKKEFILTKKRIFKESEIDRNYQLYIRPNSLNNHYHKQIKIILHGKIQSSWSDRDSQLYIYKRRVIKDIRANLFMAYIALNWPDIKVVWITRNPIDVIKSQIKMNQEGWDFNWSADNVMTQQYLLEDWLSPFLSKLLSAKSLYEKLTHKWCIETYIPHNQNVENLANVLKVNYENLIKGKNEWDKIAKFLIGKMWEKDRLESLSNIPSRTSWIDTGKRKKINKSYLFSKDEIEIIKCIIDSYGLSNYIV
jgi:hypothetical protein